MELIKIRSGALARFRKKTCQKTVAFNLTNICNYSCEYCVQTQQDFKVNQLSYDFTCQVIDVCSLHHDITALNFSGGEPTLHPRFFDIVAYARHKSAWDIQCTTNGWAGVQYFKKVREIDKRMKHGVSIHFLQYDKSIILDIIDELSLFDNTQTLLLLYCPDKIDEMRLIIEDTKLTNNVIFKIIPVLASNVGTLFYKYSKEEKLFFNMHMRNELATNFSDFVDPDGNIYRLFGSVYTLHHENNIFRHYAGMYCTTCNIVNKVREDKIWPILCDFSRFEKKIQPDSFFRHKLLRCNTNFCVCNGHTLHPKFSNMKYAPVYLGGDPNFDVDSTNINIINSSDVQCSIINTDCKYFLVT